MKALEAHGISRDDLPYKAPFQPWGAWLAFVSTIFITFFKGFDTFLPWNAPNFVTYVSSTLSRHLPDYTAPGATLRFLCSSCFGLFINFYSKPNNLRHKTLISSADFVLLTKKRKSTSLRKLWRDRKAVLVNFGILCRHINYAISITAFTHALQIRTISHEHFVFFSHLHLFKDLLWSSGRPQPGIWSYVVSSSSRSN